MAFTTHDSQVRRRDFLRTTSLVAGATLLGSHDCIAANHDVARIPLGLDGHSMRGMKWKAAKHIEFAADLKLDAVLLNSLNYFESLEPSHLNSIKELADKHQIRIYVGAGGICENAAKFSDQWGNAEQMLETGIRVATALRSPVVNVRIGSIADRFLDGGIQPRIDEAIRVLKASASRAKDAGLKFGFENHAADLRSEELVELVKEVGTDVCGVMLDPGNGLWAMEDPMKHLQTLAPYVVCNSIRDYSVWDSEDGATFQWMAIGDGMMDVPKYVKTLSQSNPEMPVFVESISNSNRPIPYLTEEHWKGYANLHASNIVDFLALCRRGKPMDVDLPPEGADKKEFDRMHQKAEFLKSIGYLRRECGAGRKS